MLEPTILSRRLAGCLLVVASIVLAGSPAAATRQALANLLYSRTASQVGQYQTRTATNVTVTVGSTPSTPSVMWPAGLVAGSSVNTVGGPFTSGTRWSYWSNGAASLQMSGPGVPTAYVKISPVTTSTICYFGKYPGACQPRYGTMKVTPGSKRFGGSARILSQGSKGQGVFKQGQFDFSFYYRTDATPMITGAAFPGNYGHFVTVTFYYPDVMASVMGTVQYTEANWTTGNVSLYAPGGYYITYYPNKAYPVVAGSHNLNTANLTGMISLVRPNLLQVFNHAGDGVFDPGLQQAGFEQVTVTFLPEPGQLVMLACGLLALASLFSLRKR